MTKILKTFGFGIVFGLGFFVIGGIGYFLLKARQTTNPGLTDSDSSALYVNSNETLTAAKRNSLVDKILGGGNGSWESVDLGDTTYFDTGCDRKRTNDGNTWYPSQNTTTRLYRNYSPSSSTTNGRLAIQYDNKSKIIRRGGGSTYGTTTALRKRCN